MCKCMTEKLKSQVPNGSNSFLLTSKSDVQKDMVVM